VCFVGLPALHGKGLNVFATLDNCDTTGIFRSERVQAVSIRGRAGSNAPPDLRWIEIDFADMLDYKDALMSEETPRCRRERIRLQAQRHMWMTLQVAAHEPARIRRGLQAVLANQPVQEIN